MTRMSLKFERTRRITGYLVGDLSRFNNAKLCEVKDRVKHAAPHVDANPTYTATSVAENFLDQKQHATAAD